MLRGINVSGQKKIKMADLKAIYEQLGLQQVVTYIQSGNVVFNSEICARTELGVQLQTAIKTTTGFHGLV